jgi:plasmid stability protein
MVAKGRQGMACVTLKKVPEKLLARLRARARADRRSMNQEALHLIDRALESDESASSRSAAQVAAWRKLSGRWKSRESVGKEIARIREARTKGRKVDL